MGQAFQPASRLSSRLLPPGISLELTPFYRSPAAPSHTPPTPLARGTPRPTKCPTTTTKPSAEGDTKASSADAVGVSPRYRPTTANPSRAGDTEAYRPPTTTTCASAEGDTKASSADAVGVSPRYCCAAKPRLPPRARTHLYYSRSAFSAHCEQSRLAPEFSPPMEESNGHS